MPTYEFRCANGHEFEQFHRRISDAPSTVDCPECGAVAQRKVSGGAGLLFKGSGFYLTDYGKNAHRKGAAASGDKGDGAGKSGDGAAPAKPEGSAKPDAGSSGSGATGASSGSAGGGAAGGAAGGGAGGGSGGGSGGGTSSGGGSSSGAKGE